MTYLRAVRYPDIAPSMGKLASALGKSWRAIFPSLQVFKLLLEPLDEPLEQPCPDLILADLVLDAVLEVRVVVDLHDDEAALGLFDVDAVEALADRPRRPHGDVDQLGWRLIELEGAKAALVRGTVGSVLDDLPVAARHAVLAHEQRLAGQDTHPPVELGRQEFLRQQEIGFLEQLIGDAAKFLRRVHLVHAARERAV